jgi:hypothetical protein
VKKWNDIQQKVAKREEQQARRTQVGTGSNKRKSRGPAPRTKSTTRDARELSSKKQKLQKTEQELEAVKAELDERNKLVEELEAELMGMEAAFADRVSQQEETKQELENSLAKLAKTQERVQRFSIALSRSRQTSQRKSRTLKTLTTSRSAQAKKAIERGFTEKAERLAKLAAKLLTEKQRLTKLHKAFGAKEDLVAKVAAAAKRARELAATKKEDREHKAWQEYQQDKMEDPEPEEGEEGVEWGPGKTKKKEKFSPGLVFLFMQMLASGVSSRSAPSVFSSNAAFFANLFGCAHEGFSAPSQQDSSRIRQAYCVLTLLHAAITLATCVSYTLHSDLSTKKGVKLGTAVLRCLMPDGSFVLAVLGGIFTQSGGTAVESADQIKAAFKQAEVLLAFFRKLLLEAQAKNQLPEGFDVDAFIPEVAPGTLGGQTAAAITDHASSATATITELQKSFKRLIHAVHCQDHVRTNMAEEGFKATNKLVLENMGERETEEFSSGREGNLTNSFIRAIYKVLQDPDYEFGAAGDFRDWRSKRVRDGEGLPRLPLRRVVGSRNDVYAENSGIILAELEEIVKFLGYQGSAKKGGRNQLEKLLLKQCGSPGILADLRARGLLWFACLQPFRTVANNTDLDRSYLDMGKAIQAMDKFLSTCAVEGLEGSADPDAEDLFHDPPLKKEYDKYRANNARAYAAVRAEIPDIPQAFEERMQKAMATGALAKMRDLAAVLLKGGKYGDPTAQQRSEMASTLPSNRLSESGFGTFNFFLNSVLNASHFTVSGLSAGQMQKTIHFLVALCEPVRDVLVRGAMQYRRKATLDDRKKLEKEKEQALARAEALRQKEVRKLRKARVMEKVLELRMDERAKNVSQLRDFLALLATVVAQRKYLQLQISGRQALRTAPTTPSPFSNLPSSA